jgi:hypothetical protein
MFAIFASLLGRFKGMFLREAAMDLEAETLQHSARRKANLERLAQHYEKDGLPEVAQGLRQQADQLNSDRPLAGILNSVEHLIADAEADDQDERALAVQPRLRSALRWHDPHAVAGLNFESAHGPRIIASFRRSRHGSKVETERPLPAGSGRHRQRRRRSRRLLAGLFRRVDDAGRRKCRSGRHPQVTNWIHTDYPKGEPLKRAILLEQFHITFFASPKASARLQQKMRRILVQPAFMRALRKRIVNLAKDHPTLSDALVKVDW